jgi:hypothetical protein
MPFFQDVIPNFCPNKQIPAKLPADMEAAVNKLKKSRNKKECLEKAYKMLSEKYHGEKLKTYARIYELFITDIGKLWEKSGYLHCTNINYLMRILLVKSGFFKDTDIKLKWTLLGMISPHQHMEVKFGSGEWVKVDIWARKFGIKLGDYAHGMHFSS